MTRICVSLNDEQSLDYHPVSLVTGGGERERERERERVKLCIDK